MAKAASKYISFDTAGNFVSELADGPAAPEATEDGSLKSAVSYALDAIVEAAGTLPDTAAALVGARAGDAGTRFRSAAPVGAAPWPRACQ